MTQVLYAPENWTASPLGDREAQLVGGRCVRCERVFFPRFKVCPNCLSREPMAPVTLSRTGRLYSYTVVHTGASPGFTAPYAIGYVDLPEGPRVFGHLDGWQEGALPLDCDVEIYGGPIGRDFQGNELVSIRFRPVRP